MESKIVNVRFRHGLGDHVYFLHLCRLWTKRGYNIIVEPLEQFKCLFPGDAASENALLHPWVHPFDNPWPGLAEEDMCPLWYGNKIAANLCAAPMPFIGSVPELWDELCGVRITTKGNDSGIDPIAKACILTHFKGSTSPERKNYPDHLIDKLMGMLDKRPEKIIEVSRCKTAEDLLIAIHYAKLVIGIDSGPLHLSRLTDTPAVGIWTANSPQTFSLPRSNTINVVSMIHGNIQSHVQRAYNMRVSRDNGPHPEDVIKAVEEVLEGA